MTHVRRLILALVCAAFLTMLIVLVLFVKDNHDVILSGGGDCRADLATLFRFPVGGNDLKDYYNAHKFGENEHLGEDWNGKGGGNTDLGDPVYAIANGMVTSSKHLLLGWGRVVRICHRLNQNGKIKYIESIYAHLDSTQVETGDKVTIGQKIGTIGTANGRYWAHLHFEMRNSIGQNLGKGYSKNITGYLHPTKFIMQFKREAHHVDR